jgi:DUF917 family protein
MAEVTIRTEREVDDLVRGLTLLGTGGGGHPHLGREYLLDHVRAGTPLRWLDLNAVPDDAWTCSVFGMGSIAPQPPLSDAERQELGYGDLTVPRPMVEAVRELARYTGLEISAIVPFELGATNTTAPFDAATRLGLGFVDADYAGRAIPELSQTTAALAGHAMAPAAIVDGWGNRLVMVETPGVQLAERIGKMISQVTKRPDPFVLCAHAGFLTRGAEMKRAVVPGTLTRSLELGAAIREAREHGEDPVRAAAANLDGWLLFTGLVTRKEWESRDGYMFGTTHIEGTGAFAGRAMRVWFKNENLVAWLDDVPLVTGPDLIMILDEASGEPYTNARLDAGHRVGVIGSVAAPQYRTEAGLRMLGPAHFGFDLPYRPIEAVIGQVAV